MRIFTVIPKFFVLVSVGFTSSVARSVSFVEFVEDQFSDNIAYQNSHKCGSDSKHPTLDFRDIDSDKFEQTIRQVLLAPFDYAPKKDCADDFEVYSEVHNWRGYNQSNDAIVFDVYDSTGLIERRETLFKDLQVYAVFPREFRGYLKSYPVVGKTGSINGQDFQVGDFIGTGQFGSIAEAKRIKDNRLAAIKFYKKLKNDTLFSLNQRTSSSQRAHLDIKSLCHENAIWSPKCRDAGLLEIFDVGKLYVSGVGDYFEVTITKLEDSTDLSPDLGYKRYLTSVSDIESYIDYLVKVFEILTLSVEQLMKFKRCHGDVKITNYRKTKDNEGAFVLSDWDSLVPHGQN